MKNNKITSFILVAGLVILIIFTIVITYNFIPNYESDSYYAKDEDITSHIENLIIKDGKLEIKTSGDPILYCVKPTKSTPTKNSLCWHKITDNYATINVILYKKYYVWIKDQDGKISPAKSISAK